MNKEFHSKNAAILLKTILTNLVVGNSASGNQPLSPLSDRKISFPNQLNDYKSA